MTAKRKIIEIDEELCDGCGQCVPACAEGAIEIIDGKAKLVSDILCDGLGACLGDCPTGALKLIEREAEEFDEDAVEERLKELEAKGKVEEAMTGTGCPSSEFRTFTHPEAAQREGGEAGPSMLRQWPIQIGLVPAHAPFLENADLLVSADCSPFVYPGIHRDFIAGRVVMVGCPKFDDMDAYFEKFTEIFKTQDINSVTVLVIEVPCCSALPMLIKKAQEKAGVEVDTEVVVLGVKGDVLERQQMVA